MLVRRAHSRINQATLHLRCNLSCPWRTGRIEQAWREYHIVWLTSARWNLTGLLLN